jgi:hypothetical protein
MTKRWLRVRPGRLALIAALILSGVLGFAVRGAKAQGDEGAGIVVSGKATSSDVGLPIYPGAKPYKDPESDSGAARLGIWGGAFGFKLAVMQMESSDAPAKISDFYRKALAKYGNVLDCTNGRTNHDDSANTLSCDQDRPHSSGGMLFKSGTKQKQYIVAVDPKGSGTKFSLISVWAKGD